MLYMDTHMQYIQLHMQYIQLHIRTLLIANNIIIYTLDIHTCYVTKP